MHHALDQSEAETMDIGKVDGQLARNDNTKVSSSKLLCQSSLDPTPLAQRSFTDLQCANLASVNPKAFPWRGTCQPASNFGVRSGDP